MFCNSKIIRTQFPPYLSQKYQLFISNFLSKSVFSFLKTSMLLKISIGGIVRILLLNYISVASNLFLEKLIQHYMHYSNVDDNNVSTFYSVWKFFIIPCCIIGSDLGIILQLSFSENCSALTTV